MAKDEKTKTAPPPIILTTASGSTPYQTPLFSSLLRSKSGSSLFSPSFSKQTPTSPLVECIADGKSEALAEYLNELLEKHSQKHRGQKEQKENKENDGLLAKRRQENKRYIATILNACYEGTPPFIWAILNGTENTTAAPLIEWGASLDYPDDAGVPPLLHALHHSNLNFIKQLFEQRIRDFDPKQNIQLLHALLERYTLCSAQRDNASSLEESNRVVQYVLGLLKLSAAELYAATDNNKDTIVCMAAKTNQQEFLHSLLSYSTLAKDYLLPHTRHSTSLERVIDRPIQEENKYSEEKNGLSTPEDSFLFYDLNKLKSDLINQLIREEDYSEEEQGLSTLKNLTLTLYPEDRYLQDTFALIQKDLLEFNVDIFDQKIRSPTRSAP